MRIDLTVVFHAELDIIGINVMKKKATNKVDHLHSTQYMTTHGPVTIVHSR